MELIETHAHLDNERFKQDVREVVARAQEQGEVSKIFIPNVDSSTIDGILELEHLFPNYCIPQMGIHPCHVKKGFEKELYEIEAWLEKRFFSAIGEIGTDLYWDKTTLPYQEEAFKIQCAWAVKYNRPVVIHCRESVEETLVLLENMESRPVKGVFHCFSGTIQQAQRVIELGYFLGVGGSFTYKNSPLPEIFAQIGMEKVVLETDSPYLTPMPNRGKRNEPAYIRLVAQSLADTLQTSISEVANTTTKNALNLYA